MSDCAACLKARRALPELGARPGDFFVLHLNTDGVDSCSPVHFIGEKCAPGDPLTPEDASLLLDALDRVALIWSRDLTTDATVRRRLHWMAEQESRPVTILPFPTN